MMKVAMRMAWVIVFAGALMTGDATRAVAAAPPAGAATQPAKTRTTAGVAFVAGKLSFAIVEDRVQLTARGEGWSSPWGDVVAAEATWSPTIDNVMALLAGQIDELSIATGTFAAEFASGDTVSGTISGTVRPGDDQQFGLQAKFIAIHGTGRFAGVSGGGTLRAIDDLDTLEFRAMLNAKLHVPR